MLTTPVTRSMGQFLRHYIAGLLNGPFYAQAYGFNSLSQDHTDAPVNEGGLNVGTTVNTGKGTWNFSAGWVSSLSARDH